MRSTRRKVDYWLITAYVIVSLPGHVGSLATGDTQFFDAFSWWFSLVILGVYALIVAYVLKLRRMPDGPLHFTVATDGLSIRDSGRTVASLATETLSQERPSALMRRRGSATTSGVIMRDQFAINLEDHELLGEVEMLTSLMIAATASAGPMSRAEIDGILGVVDGPVNEAPP